MSIWGRSQIPWKECNAMHERARFVARLLNGEKMAVVCREVEKGGHPKLKHRQ